MILPLRHAFACHLSYHPPQRAGSPGTPVRARQEEFLVGNGALDIPPILSVTKSHNYVPQEHIAYESTYRIYISHPQDISHHHQ